MEPKVLILDEPAAGLDPLGREEILGQVQALHRDRGLTVILVSHDMQDVARLAQRLLVMDQGCLVMDGPPDEVFAHADQLRALGLDVPVLSSVVQQLRARGWQLPASVRNVEQAADLIYAAYRNPTRAST